jgi:hypothetical protein
MNCVLLLDTCWNCWEVKTLQLIKKRTELKLLSLLLLHTIKEIEIFFMFFNITATSPFRFPF